MSGKEGLCTISQVHKVVKPDQTGNLTRIDHERKPWMGYLAPTTLSKLSTNRFVKDGKTDSDRLYRSYDGEVGFKLVNGLN